MTTPFMAGYHGKPWDYGDLYRYTDEGLRWLLRRFATVQVHPLGGWPYRLLHILVPGRLRSSLLHNPVVMCIFNVLDRRLPTRSPLRWLAWAEK